MNKIWLIIQREYLTRVRKKSFIVMSILGPVLMGAMMIVPIWAVTQQGDRKIIEVIDESGLFENKLSGTENIHFTYSKLTLAEARAQLPGNTLDGLLYIPPLTLDQPTGITLFYADRSPSAATMMAMEKLLKREIENTKLLNSGIDKKVIEGIRTTVRIETEQAEGGKKGNTQVATAVGYVSAFAVYIFIFLYGVQVMRGVTEEKTSRIIEVMISSVKPFQLMMGKIAGIAAVALTQFLIWVILTFSISTFISVRFQLDRFSDAKIAETMSKMPNNSDMQQAMEINSVMSLIDTVNIPLIVGCFAFYFLVGYLLYGALFGAVGAVVDNETDTQQFTLPVTLPLILAIMMVSAVLKDPDSSLSFWLSIIPLTSPIIMMVRLPFTGAGWELFLSMALLIVGFLAATWVAARIYRVGILMYGKKATYREIARWLFYKL